jgi:type IV secretory pathway VirB10-like protein
MPLPDVIADPGSAPVHTDGGAPQVHPRAGSSARVERTEDRAKAGEDVREDDLLKARSSTLFAGSDDAPLVQQGAVELPARPAEATPPTGSAATHSVESQRADDPNRQERKNDFLARAGVSGGEYLEKGLTLPRSPYEIKAGTVIPAVLITGINSDLPGAVVGQVRENVYDSVSGNYLLIPQGSRLIAAYDSMVAWGQERALLCWQRLIRPDGSSLTLDCMPGVDLAGYAGFADEVDNHWWRIIGGAALSSLLAATAQRSQGDVTGYQPSLSQSWAGGTAAGINQAGQQITEKNLQIQPTITVRPGFTVNVLVTKDIVIPPYPQPAVRR